MFLYIQEYIMSVCTCICMYIFKVYIFVILLSLNHHLAISFNIYNIAIREIILIFKIMIIGIMIATVYVSVNYTVTM